MNLENAISMEKDQDKIAIKKAELDLVNDDIYQLIDSTLPTGDEYPSTNIFYKSFYKKVNDQGGLLPNSTVLVLDAQLRAVYTTSKLN
jgi:hypothetical protein